MSRETEHGAAAANATESVRGDVSAGEVALAWDLRGAWGSRRRVRVTLAEGCALRTIGGRVDCVAVTGAYAVIDGWHLPVASVLAIGKPTVQDIEDYDTACAAALAEYREVGLA